MLVENKIYPNFKSYSHYKKNAEDLSNNNSPAKSRNYKAIVGSAAGVACALALCSRFPKKKTTLENAREILKATINTLENVGTWENRVLFEKLNEVATNLNLKSMSIMWVVRLAVSGGMVTVGGATEIMEVIGKEESIDRLIRTLDRLQ